MIIETLERWEEFQHMLANDRIIYDRKKRVFIEHREIIEDFKLGIEHDIIMKDFILDIEQVEARYYVKLNILNKGAEKNES